jgi:hypothetical protein
MEENDSTTSEKKSLTYFNLLQEMDKLLNWLTNMNNPGDGTQKMWDISEIETIFNNMTENIDRMIEKMGFERKSMVLVMIMNTIIRIAANDGCNFIISRRPFQLLIKHIHNSISAMLEDMNYFSMCASNLLDSMLMNFVKDSFAEICFKRLLSKELVSTVGNAPCCSYF